MLFGIRSMATYRLVSMLEKAKLVSWFEETKSLSKTARRYKAEFGVEPPEMNQVKKWHEQFITTGSIESNPTIESDFDKNFSSVSDKF